MVQLAAQHRRLTRHMHGHQDHPPRATIRVCMAWHHRPRVLFIMAPSLVGRVSLSLRAAQQMQSTSGRARFSLPQLFLIARSYTRHCASKLRQDPPALTVGYAKHGHHGPGGPCSVRGTGVNFAQRSVKSTMLAAAAQLAIPREERSAQGHRRDSAKLYSRNDTYDSLRVQRRLALQLAQGWRANRSMARGGSAPIAEPPFSVSSMAPSEFLKPMDLKGGPWARFTSPTRSILRSLANHRRRL